MTHFFAHLGGGGALVTVCCKIFDIIGPLSCRGNSKVKSTKRKRTNMIHNKPFQHVTFPRGLIYARVSK